MAPDIQLLSLFLLTFLLTDSPIAFARDLPASSEISLVTEPEENYYIVRKKSVVITCQARNAADIIFTCMGTQIPPSSIEMEDSLDFDPSVLQASIEVTRADVQNYDNGKDPFWCECSALDVDNQVAITSRRAFVSLATLKHKFQIHPESVTATRGEIVEFACGVPVGNPKPEVIWRKDRKRLNIEADPRLLVTDLGSLVIESVMKEDAGSYQCVARNEAGRRESNEAELTVSESAEPEVEITDGAVSESKPRFPRQSAESRFVTIPKKSYTVTEDNSVLIHCGAVRADIITFRCNEKRVSPDSQTTDQGKDQEGNKLIESTISVNFSTVEEFLRQSSNHKKYQCVCVAWRQVGNQWKHITSGPENGFVYLSYLEENFKVEPSDVTAGRGTNATMVCEPPRGQPNPWIQWFKERTIIEPRQGNKYSMSAAGHLTIHNVQDSDAGNYNCVAENEVGSKHSRYGRLIVVDKAPSTTPPPGKERIPIFPEVIPDSPQFLQDVDREYTLTDSVTVTCSAIRTEHLTINCGGTRLKDAQVDTKKLVDEATGIKMTITSVEVTAEMVSERPDDYFCQCIGWYLKEGQWSNVIGGEGYIRASTSYIEDDFITSPTSTDVELGNTARFRCEPPRGDPTPRVYWFKDGEFWDYESTRRPIIFHEGTLYIENTIPEDEGTYVCVAENTAGRRESFPAYLELYQTTTTLPPTSVPETTTEIPSVETSSAAQITSAPFKPLFTFHPEPISYVTKDVPATLNCVAKGVKTTIFVCNGKTIPETLHTGFHSQDPQTKVFVRENSLTITKEEVDSFEGRYTCVCRFLDNDKPVDSEPGYIEVAYLRRGFRGEPVDTEVPRGGKLELACSPPQGTPEPQITWEKDGIGLPEEDRIVKHENGILTIEDFRESDVGSYVCIAQNIAKQRNSQAAYVSLSADGAVGEPEPVPSELPEPEPETTGAGIQISQPGIPFFSKDLHSVYYFVDNQPVTIKCEAKNAQEIKLVCADEDLSIPILKRVDEMGDEVTVAQIDLTREVVEQKYRGIENLWCQCHSLYQVAGGANLKTVSSQRGYFEEAFLDEEFRTQHPNEMETVEEGVLLTLKCLSPIGHPEPRVSWTRDGKKVEHFSQSPTGDLILTQTRIEDSGNYQCIAENEAGKRMSNPVFVQITAAAPDTCTNRLNKCLKNVPDIIDDNFCKNTKLDEFRTCKEQLAAECRDNTNNELWNILSTSGERVEEKCEAGTSEPEPEGEGVPESETGTEDESENESEGDPNGKGAPEGEPEGEGTPEGEPEGEPESTINEEGNLEASKDSGNGSTALYSSVLLATFLQLLVAAILSQR